VTAASRPWDPALAAEPDPPGPVTGVPEPDLSDVDLADPGRATLDVAGTVEVSAWATSPAKRAFDLALALPLALVTLPVLVVLCAVSAVVFRANPLFTQERIGLDGRRLRFVKLRSLAASVPSDIDKYALASQPLGRWGRFVRRSHLDELPQLWLVLAGQMSLVGPRPELPAIAATFDADFVRRRARVRPGVTGPWQVSEAARGLIGEAPQFDDLYVASASVRLDLWVLIRTCAAAFGAAPVTFEDCLSAADHGAPDAGSSSSVPSAG